MIDIVEVISRHPLAMALHKAHESVLRNERTAEVPEQYIPFMIEYRDAYKHKTTFLPLHIDEDFDLQGGEILWFSGGSDSVLLSALLPKVARVTATNFFPIPDFRFKQEFQLALAASVLGTKIIYLGTNSSDSDYGNGVEIWDYENNLAFAELWSRHFQSQLRYPLAEQNLDKVDVYIALRDKNLLSDLVHCKHNPPCWACFDCVLHHFLLEGLGVLPHPQPDPATVHKAFDYAAASILFGEYDDPHFVKVLSKLNDLYGYRPPGAPNAIYS